MHIFIQAPTPLQQLLVLTLTRESSPGSQLTASQTSAIRIAILVGLKLVEYPGQNCGLITHCPSENHEELALFITGHGANISDLFKIIQKIQKRNQQLRRLVVQEMHGKSFPISVIPHYFVLLLIRPSLVAKTPSWTPICCLLVALFSCWPLGQALPSLSNGHCCSLTLLVATTKKVSEYLSMCLAAPSQHLLVVLVPLHLCHLAQAGTECVAVIF